MIALDTNILVYAAAQSDPEGRDDAARALLDSIAPVPTAVPLQVLGEFLNVCRRKRVMAIGVGAELVDIWLERYDCPPTASGDLITAASLSGRYDLAFFDALICAVAGRIGATMLLSEDMQDGLNVEGLRIVNPFAFANETLIADLIGSVL